jgi:hypothetical protein
MIIILEPQKDTYVTNLKTQNNDASLANVGHAATLDLFKLYNENKNAHSWAVFEFSNTITDLINDGQTLTLTDSLGVSKTFEFDTDPDPGVVVGNNIRINIKAANDVGDNSTYAATIASVINSVDELDILAYNNSNNQLILKQNKPGDQGDTNIVFNMSNTTLLNEYDDGDGNIIKKFARIEYSNILIKFDLENFKKQWNIGNSLEGAFSNLKAEFILKDVTTGISKPKDYNLELYSLNKDFDEGIGKDTIYFSDSDTCNFKNISSTQAWEVQSIISGGDATTLIQRNTANENVTTSSGNIDEGDEDLVFNITDYIQSELASGEVNAPTLSDKGFLVKFVDSDIYDNKSYFVKRLGSRHLINKQFVPQLRIKIDDSSYNIPTNSFNKLRYLDNAEDFYLFNRANGNLISFNEPDTVRNGWTIMFNIGSLITNKDTTIPTNFSGDPLQGARKASITASEMSRYNRTISSYLESNKTYKDTIKWCYKNIETAGNFIEGSLYKIVLAGTTDFTDIGAVNDNPETLFVATGVGAGTGTALELDLASVNVDDDSSLVTATNFVIGNLYKIVSAGDGVGANTDFTEVGASDSVAGTLFIATGVGAGTGSAYEIDISSIKEIEHTILTDTVEFKTAETSNETRYENLITSIRITENDLFANDGTNSVEVYFVDTKKEFTAVKVPYELPSENIGNVFYQIYDVESGKILVDYDEDEIIANDLNAAATKMFYDGEKYKFNLFVPKLFKNLRINFKFKYKDPITNVDKFIFNEKYSVRIV